MKIMYQSRKAAVLAAPVYFFLCWILLLPSMTVAAEKSFRQAGAPQNIHAPSLATKLALAEQNIQFLQKQIADLEKQVAAGKEQAFSQGNQQEEITKRLTVIENIWTVKWAKNLGILVVLGTPIIGFILWFLPRRLGAIIKNGREGLEQEIIERILSEQKASLTRLFDEQMKENLRRILARDKKILILADRDDDEARRLKRSLVRLGFSRFVRDLTEAEAVMVVGKDECTKQADPLAQQLQGQPVPVIFYYYGEGWMKPSPISKFELATLANSLPTALMHLHNMAMLTVDSV